MIVLLGQVQILRLKPGRRTKVASQRQYRAAAGRNAGAVHNHLEEHKSKNLEQGVVTRTPAITTTARTERDSKRASSGSMIMVQN